MKYYAGFDIGTSGVRCAIFDVDGKLVPLVRQQWLSLALSGVSND